MDKFRLKVEGMSCGHCVKAVKTALQQQPGVNVREVAIGKASGEFDAEQTSPSRLADALASAGYPAVVEGA